MKPYLFDFMVQGHLIRVPSFGAFLATAFSVAYFWSLRNARRLGVESKHIERLFLLILIASAIGARLFHVLFEEPTFYWNHPSKIIAIWEGGSTLYGSVLCCMLTVYLYCKREHLELGNIMDLSATSTVLSLSIGRLGCFFAGCCWGKTCTLPWAVTFTHPEAFNTVHGLSVHPTQLYESFGAFLLFIFCQKRLFNRSFSGEVVLKAVIGYSVLRFFVEWFRGDAYRGFVFNGLLSYSQAISLFLAIAAICILVPLSRKHPH